MPNPLDALKKAQTIGADPQMTNPTLGAMPMLPEGALTGLVGLAGKWLPKAAPEALQGLIGKVGQSLTLGNQSVPVGVQGLPDGAEVVIRRLAASARPIVQGMKNAGAFAGDRTVGGLNSLASRAATAPVTETLGEMNPEFTAAGGEGLYNMARQGAKKVVDPIEAAYERLKLMGGR